MNRINEITFNSSLIGEYRAIGLCRPYDRSGSPPQGIGPGQYRRINIHRIVLDRSAPISTLSANSPPITTLRKAACQRQRAARRFLDEHFDDIGVKSTVDLRAEAQAEWA